MDNKLVVCVWMVCYNQEKYISQAIESVISQQTSFSFKLFIGDDCSTDRTQEICIAYKNQYPEKIELVLNKKNLGAMQNALNIYSMCFNSPAKYIAMLEGDDYWTDYHKLQKQVDFLESNLSFVGCCGNSVYKSETDKNIDGKKLHSRGAKKYSVTDLVQDNYIMTLTVMFRNIPSVLNILSTKIRIGDWPLFCCLAEHGDFYYFDEVWGVYRVHPGGIYSTLNNYKRSIEHISTHVYIYKYFEGKYSEYFKPSILKRFNHIAYNLSFEGDYPYWKLRANLIPVLGFKEFDKLIIFSLKRTKFYFLLQALLKKIKIFCVL